jgi:chemotaxis protein CheX
MNEMTDTDGTPDEDNLAQIVLPESLDLRAASPLASKLLSARGKGVTIDASRASTVGAQCLQVILSAKLTWRRDGQSFVIKDPSEAFLVSLSEAGLSAEILMESEIDS